MPHAVLKSWLSPLGAGAARSPLLSNARAPSLNSGLTPEAGMAYEEVTILSRGFAAQFCAVVFCRL